jgi:hypothetical protein
LDRKVEEIEAFAAFYMALLEACVWGAVNKVAFHGVAGVVGS